MERTTDPRLQEIITLDIYVGATVGVLDRAQAATE